MAVSAERLPQLLIALRHTLIRATWTPVDEGTRKDGIRIPMTGLKVDMYSEDLYGQNREVDFPTPPPVRALSKLLS